MKYCDLRSLNALSDLLDKINALRAKRDNDFKVRITFNGSGYEEAREISDPIFLTALRKFLNEQRGETVKRIEALGVAVKP